MNRLFYTLAALAALAGAATAAPPTKASKEVPKSRKLFVESTNDQQAFGVTVRVNHPDKAYGIGEEVIVTVTSDKDGYLYLFNQDVHGEIVCLFPNTFSQKNGIAAGAEIRVPAPGDTFRIRTSEAGTEVVKAIVVSEPLKTLSLDELTKGAKGPKKVDLRKFAKLVLEAAGVPGSQDLTLVDPNPDDLKNQVDKFKEQDNKQYVQKAKQWAEATVELVVEGKGGKPEPTQGGKPEPTQGGKPDPTQGGKPEPKPNPGKQEPTQGGKPEPTQGGKPNPGKQEPTPTPGKQEPNPGKQEPTQGKPMPNPGKQEPLPNPGKQEPTQGGKPDQSPVQGEPKPGPGKQQNGDQGTPPPPAPKKPS